ncbi:GILT-like protein 2 [Drosophila bipectinata]|uniref:GILT-like protein 2 n=1 Tax=Drosophila bipectinata TaxID=42026 RepID=UPI001C8AC4C9|nr:GILT-like protein 2 [Drosophila bipectinata]
MKAFLNVCLLILGFVAVATAKRRGPVRDKLPVTLYYEALCPYCREFVTSQLLPAMMRLNLLPFTELTLVPYGNAKLDDAGNVVCQHGVDECELNAWHGCILEHHNVTQSFKLIACMMRGKRNRLDKCADRYKIDVGDVKKCKATRSVNEILAKYRQETAKVSFNGVPAIALDNIYDAHESEQLSDNFDVMFCAKYKKKFNKSLNTCP